MEVSFAWAFMGFISWKVSWGLCHEKLPGVSNRINLLGSCCEQFPGVSAIRCSLGFVLGLHGVSSGIRFLGVHEVSILQVTSRCPPSQSPPQPTLATKSQPDSGPSTIWSVSFACAFVGFSMIMLIYSICYNDVYFCMN